MANQSAESGPGSADRQDPAEYDPFPNDPFENDPGEETLFSDTESDLCRVLIVDDEPQILKALSRLLSSVDCEVLEAANGGEAVEILDARPIGVLISDQRMPGISGGDLLRHAAQHHPKTVRIMLTGNGQLDTAMEAINRGQVFRFVAKPWSHDQFVGIVEDAIDQHYLLRSQERYRRQIRRQNERLRQLNDQLEARVAQRTRQVTARSQEIAELNEQLEASFGSTIKVMLSIMELGDINVVGHCRRTARLVAEFGAFLGLDVDRLRHLERAALLHWLGLLNAPPEMLEKPVEAFDAEEMATWEFHPTLGYQAIARVDALERTSQIIAHYNHRWDDPDFVAGDAVDLDTVDACYMLNICSRFEQTRRIESNRGELDRRAAIECGLARLQAGRGGEFAPEFVDQFGSMITARSDHRHASRRIELDELEVGMVLSRPVETAKGGSVAPRDMVLTDAMIERLEQLSQAIGIGAIFVAR